MGRTSIARLAISILPMDLAGVPAAFATMVWHFPRSRSSGLPRRGGAHPWGCWETMRPNTGAIGNAPLASYERPHGCSCRVSSARRPPTKPNDGKSAMQRVIARYWRSALLAATIALWAGLAPALAEKRVALVIGNPDYRDVPALANPRNDAEDVAAALKRLGFETTVGLDADRAAMEKAIEAFATAVEGADVALFYYAGHGMQHQGVNYLMPTDANLQNAAGLRRLTKLNDVVADVKRARTLRIMILDACRDNPLVDVLENSPSAVASRGVRSVGLAKLSRTAGSGDPGAAAPSRGGDIIVYAAESGHTAADGVGRNSPFSAAFVRNVETEGQEVVALVRRRALSGRQG